VNDAAESVTGANGPAVLAALDLKDAGMGIQKSSQAGSSFNKVLNNFIGQRISCCRWEPFADGVRVDGELRTPKSLRTP